MVANASTGRTNSLKVRQRRALAHAQALYAVLLNDIRQGEIAEWDEDVIGLRTLTERLYQLGVRSPHGKKLTCTGFMRALSHVSRTWQGIKKEIGRSKANSRLEKSRSFSRSGLEKNAKNELDHFIRSSDKVIPLDPLCERWKYFAEDGIFNLSFRSFLKIKKKFTGSKQYFSTDGDLCDFMSVLWRREKLRAST